MSADTLHEAFPQPPDAGVKIWRYMDFAKYVAMLKDKALYFARVDTLGDPFEGSLSKAEFEHWNQVARDREAKGEVPTRWQGRYLDVLLGNARRARRQCYVNCWHVNPSESDAMWRLYSESGYAIAIVSTYSLLAECLPTDFEHGEHRGPFLGVVKYADHHHDVLPTGNIFHAIMHKRSSFAHEQECRALVWRIGRQDWPEGVPEQVLDTFPLGLHVPVALDSLIQEVIVSPAAPAWFSDLVADTTIRYGFTFPVETSALALSPYF